MSDAATNLTPTHPDSPSMPFTIARWAARLVVAGVFLMGAIPKFTGQADALVDRIPGGATSAMAIGVIEAVAIILILVPATARYGAVLAALFMLGAIGSHFGPIGFEDGMATMFVMAVVAFIAAVAAAVMEFRAAPA